MFQRLLLWFIPHPNNNRRAFLLHPATLTLFVALYFLNQSLIYSLTIFRPGVLGYSSDITAAKVIAQTNARRQQQKLPPLKLNSTLSQSATLKAQDMFAANYWAHNSPTGKTPWDFFKAVGYRYAVAGENLARDFANTESMIAAWMKSPSHRANILDRRFKEIGIGVVNGTLGGVKTTLVVQHFAAPYVGKVAEAPPTPSPDVVTPDLIASIPELASPVLAGTTQTPSEPLVSPLSLSRALGLFLASMLVIALVIDLYYVLRYQPHRLFGSSLGHLGLIIFLIISLLFSQPGHLLQFINSP